MTALTSRYGEPDDMMNFTPDPKRWPKRPYQRRSRSSQSYRFKAKAVQLSALDGVMIKDAAESLDIHPVTLAKGI